jgi:hypothetical protein
MSAKKSHAFVLALTKSKGTLINHATLSNGHSELKRSKHEFIGRIAFASIQQYNTFIEEFSGDIEPTESAGGCTH